MKRLKIGLLPRILVAIVLGIVFGQFLPMGGVRIFATFNGIFGQFLGFLIPLIIVGLVTPAIAEVGRMAGRLLLVTVLIAYLDTSLAALLGYGVGSLAFPSLVTQGISNTPFGQAEAIVPYFNIEIPVLIDVMTALVLSFLLGLGIAFSNGSHQILRGAMLEFRSIIGRVIEHVVIPLLPLYIFGIFLMMTVTGEAYHIVSVFAKIIVVIFLLHLFILFYEFCLAGALVRKNPFRLLWNMLPAYMTALGTSSSAATIPVTLKQTLKNGVSEGIAGFTVPLFATIHMPGSAMKITTCALTICLLSGMPHDAATFIHFVLMLGVVMVAAPGVPGGSIMAALGVLASILHFDADQQALMIALYIAMDSFGTACNVTGDGAIALIVDKYYAKKHK